MYSHVFVFRFAHNFLAIGTDPAERSGGGGGFREGCIDLIKFKINLNIVPPPPPHNYYRSAHRLNTQRKLIFY